MRMLEHYQERIDRRKEREDFVTKHGLLSDKTTVKQLSESRIKREIRDNVASLLRFFPTSQEVSQLVGCLALRTELKGLVRLLSRCRRLDRKMTFEAAFTILEKKRFKREQTSKTTSKGFKVLYERMDDGSESDKEEGMSVLKKKVKENLGLDWEKCSVVQVSGLDRLDTR